MIFARSDGRQSLVVVAAQGPDADALQARLVRPLAHGGDGFSSVSRSGKSSVIADALEPRAMRRVPRRHLEAVGSSAFGVYPCQKRGDSTALVMVDAEQVELLPFGDRSASSKPLRERIARIAERL